MIELLWLAGGVVLGGLAAWWWSRSHTRNVLADDISEALQSASSAEGTVIELRNRLMGAEEELQSIRGALESETERRVRAETQAVEAAKSIQEQKELLAEARKALTDTFKALSGDALKSNNQAFLDLAKKSLEAVLAEAKGDLSKRQEAIGGLVKPLGESLKAYEGHMKALEQSRQKAYGGLEEQVKRMALSQQQLQRETSNLVSALRRPEVRGRWGELQLRRVAELAGMVEHCDFDEQVTVASSEGRLRPDMIVHLPAGREVVVDSKVALDAYLDAVNAQDEKQRAQCLDRHAAHLRAHMRSLSAKAYWDQFTHAPEFVVMFIPGESFFAAAVERDPSLIEDSMQRRVVPATPTTLITLLLTVAYGWQEAQIAQNARLISEAGKELYGRLRTLSTHFQAMRNGLRRANEAYNQAVGSLEQRVFPSARKLRELGAAGAEEIPPAEPVETEPRTLSAPEAVDDPPEGETAGS